MARVLVAEDDDDIRALLHFVLAKVGHRVETAPDGRGALERYRPGAFDLLCIDLDMPRLNGVGLTRAVRCEHRDNVPILMLTGSATTSDLQDARAAGIDAMLHKPFSIHALHAQIDALLSA